MNSISFYRVSLLLILIHHFWIGKYCDEENEKKGLSNE